MTFGAKVSKTICLIHGWGLGPRIWDDFICRMPEDWRSITLAMPGYGERESNADVYSDNNVIADHLIDKIPDNAILVAWSLGGLIAIRLAQHLGDRLEMLILLASTPCFTKKKDWSFGVTEEKINKVARQLTVSREKALQQFIRETAVGDDSPRTTIRLLQDRLLQDVPDTKTLNTGLDILRETDLREEFKSLECRTGMILGQNDQFVLLETGPAAHKICTQTQLVTIDAAGHAPFISQRDQTMQALFDLVEQAA